MKIKSFILVCNKGILGTGSVSEREGTGRGGSEGDTVSNSLLRLQCGLNFFFLL